MIGQVDVTGTVDTVNGNVNANINSLGNLNLVAVGDVIECANFPEGSKVSNIGSMNTFFVSDNAATANSTGIAMTTRQVFGPVTIGSTTGVTTNSALKEVEVL